MSPPATLATGTTSNMLPGHSRWVARPSCFPSIYRQQGDGGQSWHGRRSRPAFSKIPSRSDRRNTNNNNTSTTIVRAAAYRRSPGNKTIDVVVSHRPAGSRACTAAVITLSHTLIELFTIHITHTHTHITYIPYTISLSLSLLSLPLLPCHYCTFIVHIIYIYTYIFIYIAKIDIYVFIYVRACAQRCVRAQQQQQK